MVSSLFRLHKKAKPSHKLWALYVIDAIAREAKNVVKKGKARDNGKGSAITFLQKLEVCLERIVDESAERGPPEHKVITVASFPSPLHSVPIPFCPFAGRLPSVSLRCMLGP
jgi:hypothetical protein